MVKEFILTFLLHGRVDSQRVHRFYAGLHGYRGIAPQRILGAK